MSRARRAYAAVLCATALIAPPAYADSTEHYGFSCGYAFFDDLTGAVWERNYYHGEISGGPIVVADVLDDHGHTHLDPAPRVTLHCVVQLDDFNYHVDRHDEPLHCDLTGQTVVVGACLRDYHAAPTSTTYLCVWLTVEHADQHEVVLLADDDGDPRNGWQCDDTADPGWL